MIDSFGRKIDYLRISLCDRCNMRCLYCMKEEGITKFRHDDILSFEEIEMIVKALAKLGIKKVRLTGGEPLLRSDVEKLCMLLKKIEGIKELCLTTNGYLLKDKAKTLKEAGVDRINISLDSLDKDKYFKITRGADLETVLDAIKEAKKYFKIKINTVLLKGFNDGEIDDFIAFAKDNQVDVRFIELMPIGVARDFKDCLLDPQKVLDQNSLLEKTELIEGVAKIYKIKDSSAKIGAISALSHSFCEKCDRLRLTSDGYLKTCLFAKKEFDLKGLRENELESALKKIISLKPASKNSEELTKRDMNEIGG